MQKIMEIGLERCAVDPRIFRRISSGKREVYLVDVYVVDDLIVTGRPDDL